MSRAFDPPTAAAESPRIEIVDRESDLLRLESEWNELMWDSEAASPFLTWEWVSAWWETYGAEAMPWVICARDAYSNRLLGVAPLVVRKRSTHRELSFLGGGDSGADHLDFVVRRSASPAVLDALLASLARPHWDVVRLEGASRHSAAVQHLVSGARGALVLERMCPKLSLPGAWEDLLEGLSRKQRYNLRSRAMRLERDAYAPVSTTTVSDDSQLHEAMEELFELHHDVRRRRHEALRFGVGASYDFHQRVARRFLKNDWLRLHFLRVGSDAIAASYCIQFRKTVHFYQTGHDGHWSRYGPGMAILAASIREAIREGAETFDFLRGDEGYKQQWAGELEHDLRVQIPTSLRGRVWVAGFRTARSARASYRDWQNTREQSRLATADS